MITIIQNPGQERVPILIECKNWKNGASIQGTIGRRKEIPDTYMQQQARRIIIIIVIYSNPEQWKRSVTRFYK